MNARQVHKKYLNKEQVKVQHLLLGQKGYIGDMSNNIRISIVVCPSN